MSHLKDSSATQLHCILDWLGKSVVALLMTVGLLYGSAYTLGWPNLPDPDKHWRRDHGPQPKHVCPRDDVSVE
jgi:hypothetical protein